MTRTFTYLQSRIVLWLDLALELDVLVLGAADVIQVLDEDRKSEVRVRREVGQAALRGLQQPDLFEGALSVGGGGK